MQGVDGSAVAGKSASTNAITFIIEPSPASRNWGMYSTTAADSQNTCERQRSNRETGSVNDIGKAKQEGRGFYSNVRDPNLNWSKRGLNARTCTISLGPAGDKDSPVAAIGRLNSGRSDDRRVGKECVRK